MAITLVAYYSFGSFHNIGSDSGRLKLSRTGIFLNFLLVSWDADRTCVSTLITITTI